MVRLGELTVSGKRESQRALAASDFCESHVLCCWAAGKREKVLCLDWNTYSVMVFHKRNAALSRHFWIEFLPASLYLLCYRFIYLCSAVQCWIFDMCVECFVALDTFWLVAMVHYPSECVLPFWALHPSHALCKCAFGEWIMLKRSESP